MLLKPQRGIVGGPGYPNKINRRSPLSRSLLLAWAGHHGMDLISGIRPAYTSVTRATNANRRSHLFTGGAEGASDLNFGTHAPTANLGAVPATWAFYFTAASAAALCLAAQNDGNSVDRGWQVAGAGTTFGLAIERSGSNMRVTLNDAITANVPMTLVCTSDGTALGAGVRLYLNGIQKTPFSSSDGSGTTGPATAQSLYLGRKRFDTPASHNGNIFVALIADRIWSAAEAAAFHKDPYSVFEAPGAIPMGAPSVGPSPELETEFPISLGLAATMDIPAGDPAELETEFPISFGLAATMDIPEDVDPSVVWGPEEFPDEYSTEIDNANQVVLAVPVDGSTLPSTFNALSLRFVDGYPNEVQCNGSEDDGGGIVISVGVDPDDIGASSQIWRSRYGFGHPDVPTWDNIVTALIEGDTVPGFNEIAPFTNPNPTGTFYILFVALAGPDITPQGFRNFAIELLAEDEDEDPSSDTETMTWDVDTRAPSRTIIQYRESAKLNRLIRLHRRLLRGE